MVLRRQGYPLVVTMAEPFSVERRRMSASSARKGDHSPAADRAVGMVKKAIELAKKTVVHDTAVRERANARHAFAHHGA